MERWRYVFCVSMPFSLFIWYIIFTVTISLCYNMQYNSSSAKNSPFEGIPISTAVYRAMEAAVPRCQKAIDECNESGSRSDCDDAYSECMSLESTSSTFVHVQCVHTDFVCYFHVCQRPRWSR